MKPDELKRKLSDTPMLWRVYTERTYNVIEDILKSRQVQSILDFSAIPQSFIFPLSEKLHPNVAIAIPTRIQERGMDPLIQDSLYVPEGNKYRMPTPSSDSFVQWATIDSSFKETRFDLVLGIIGSREDLEQAVKFIDTDGIGIFHVHTYFFTSLLQAGPIGDNCNYIQSSLVVPSSFIGQYFHEAFEDEYLILVEASEQDSIFIGHITDDKEKNETLVENMQERRRGKTLKYGMFSDIHYLQHSEEKYHSQSFSLSKKVQGGRRPVIEYSHRVSEVVTDIQFLIDQEPIEHEPNTYITSLPDIDTVGAGYAAISLDNTQILVDYFALYIEEGIKNWKEYVPPSETEDSGSLLLRFRRYETWLGTCKTKTDIVHRILNTWILVPDISTQREVIRIAKKIDNMAEYLTHLREQLWGDSEDILAIETEVETLGDQDTFSVWLSRLPIPLSTILWSYNTSSDTGEQVEDIFFFLEVAAQLLSVLLLSVLVSDENYFNSHKGKILKGVKREKFLTASMGSWVVLGSQLSRYILKELGNESDTTLRELISEISVHAIETLCDSKLWATFQEASSLRNIWKGHSGKANRSEMMLRLERLSNMIQRVRTSISGRTSDLKFIVRKEEVRLLGGYHTYNIEYFEGYAAPLKKDTLRTKIPLETDCLYVVGSDSEKPVKMLPFVKIIIDTEEQSVAYFYNRKQDSKDAFRFVSYQRSKSSEILLTEEEIGSGFDVLT